MREIGVGLVGAGFIAELHAEGLLHVPEARIRGVAARTEASARRFGERHGVETFHDDYRRLLDDDEVHVISIACPNDLHHEVAVAAAGAGKHVICEKPLARTLAEADEMIAACDSAGVLLMYAEEVCFVPKYLRAKQLVDEGALGRVFAVRQGEQHFGPHADWFWDVERSGGGVLMDMGCHGIEFVRWIYDKPPVEHVTATLGTYVHGDRTRGDDHAVVTMQLAGNRLGVVETSWAKRGGMDDRAEVLGSGGVTYVDLLRGSSLLTYSEQGYGYALEKAPDTRGWGFTMFQEAWNYGFPQEMRHFIECVQHSSSPLEDGHDGRAVLEIIYAMYRAASGQARVDLPLELSPDEAGQSPISGWQR